MKSSLAACCLLLALPLLGENAEVTRDVNLRQNPSTALAPLVLLQPPQFLTLLDSSTHRDRGFRDGASSRRRLGAARERKLRSNGAILVERPNLMPAPKQLSDFLKEAIADAGVDALKGSIVLVSLNSLQHRVACRPAPVTEKEQECQRITEGTSRSWQHV